MAPHKAVAWPAAARAPRMAHVALLLQRRRQLLPPVLSVAWNDDPVVAVRGQGQYLIDHGGRSLLDLVVRAFVTVGRWAFAGADRVMMCGVC